MFFKFFSIIWKPSQAFYAVAALCFVFVQKIKIHTEIYSYENWISLFFFLKKIDHKYNFLYRRIQFRINLVFFYHFELDI